MKKNIEKMYKIAEFDFRKIWPYKKEKFFWEDILLDNNETSSIDLYINYKKDRSKEDLDDSNRKFLPMRTIYQMLWGQYVNDKVEVPSSIGYSNFRANKIFGDGFFFGGDTIHSLIAETDIKKNDNNIDEKIKKGNYADFVSVAGTMGNYVLVPAYFNVDGHKSQSWHCALKQLEQIEKWDVAEKAYCRSRGILKKDEEIKKRFDQICFDFVPQEHFSKYINCMFLWDYICVHISSTDESYKVKDTIQLQDRPNEIAKIIRRRSFYMAAMLIIAVELKKLPYKGSYIIKEDWQDWDVSDYYKVIMQEVFLVDKLYSGYDEVFDAINKLQLGKEVDEIIKEARAEIISE